MNTWDKCKNCGGERGLHHYETDQCPVGGREAPIGRKQEWKSTTFELETPEPVVSGLVKAEQQLTGFDHRHKGGDIISLVESMGLKADEWQQLKKDMPWLAKDLIERIDEHFAPPSKTGIVPSQWYLVRKDRNMQPWAHYVYTIPFRTATLADTYAELHALAGYHPVHGFQVQQYQEDESAGLAQIIYMEAETTTHAHAVVPVRMAR